MTCGVEGCDRPVRVISRQLCGTHYKHYLDGKPLVPLNNYRRAQRVDEAGKSCTNCNRYQPWSEYTTKPTGNGYASWCNACKTEVSNNRYHNNKKAVQ